MIINTTVQDQFISQGTENEEFTLSFDFTLGLSSIVVFINEALLSSQEYTFAQSANNDWVVTIRTGHTLTAGDAVLIRRVTSLTQAILYQLGSSVPQKNIVAALDKLTLISQEHANAVDNLNTTGRVTRTVIYHGVTAGVSIEDASQDPLVVGPLAFAVMNNENTRTLKNNNDLLVSPALVNFRTPDEAGKFFYLGIAMPNEWGNLFFSELGIFSQIWSKYNQTIPLNDTDYAVWFRKQPIANNKTLPVIVNRFE